MLNNSNTDQTTEPKLASSDLSHSDRDSRMTATVEALAQSVAADAIHPKAQVIMPTEEQLTLHLVKLDDVLQIQEIVSDENLVAGAFMTLVGALLGIGVNLVTSDVTLISKATWVAIVANVLFLIALGFYWRRLHNRYKEALKKLNQEATHEEP